MRKMLKILCRNSKDYVSRKEVWHIPKEERPAAIFQIALHAVNYDRDMAIKMVNELCDQEEKDLGFWHNAKVKDISYMSVPHEPLPCNFLNEPFLYSDTIDLINGTLKFDSLKPIPKERKEDL